MVTIQLSDGFLDIPKTEVELSWKTVRFSEGLADPYSNDFEIPKTDNNVNILQCAGLLDSYVQPLGDQIAPCAYVVGSHAINAYIQVVSVTDKHISICLFEKTIPEDVLDINIAELLRDTDDDIFVWNVNTQPAYPNWFRKYKYSSTVGVNPNYAQIHPSTDLNDVIHRVNQLSGAGIPDSPSLKYAVATKKTVSPHNKMQVIEGHWTKDSGNFAVLSGGQHITNDCEFSYSPTTTEITFNRNCKIRGWIYYSFKKKDTVTNSFYMTVCRYRNQTPVYAPAYQISSSAHASYVHTDIFNTTIESGDVIRVMCNNTNKYDMLNFVLVFEISDYTISDEDYDTELKYVGRAPRLDVWSDDGMFKFGNQSWQQKASSNGGDTHCFFDGTTYRTHYHYTGSPNQQYVQAFTLPWMSIAYFQYWCNLPDIKIKDLMYGLCWTDGKKLVSGFQQNMNMLVPSIWYADADDKAVIDGRITETFISSDTLGRKNYILMNGEERKASEPVSSIPNRWLESEKTIHESPFSYAPHKWGDWYCINQYSDFEHDPETDEFKARFEDVDGFAIANAGPVGTMLYRYELDKMGFDRMNQSIEVTIETFDDCKDLDFVYLEGRKYMVIEGSKDLETGFGELRALLCPVFEERIEPVHQHPEPAEEQWGDVEEGYYPDPNDDFDNGEENPAYDNWNPWYDIGNEPVDPTYYDIWDWEGYDDPWTHDPDDWG